MRSKRRSNRRKSKRKMSTSPKDWSNTCSRPRGFSMIAHCKAIGKIRRTGKKNKGRYIKSPKYRRSRK